MTKNSLNACPKCGGPADNGLPWYLNTIRSLETQLAEARVNSTPDTSPAVFLKAWDAIVNTKQAPEGTYAWAKWGWETAIKAIAQPTPDRVDAAFKQFWDMWYGKYRGNMPVDAVAVLIEDCKRIGRPSDSQVGCASETGAREEMQGNAEHHSPHKIKGSSEGVGDEVVGDKPQPYRPIPPFPTPECDLCDSSGRCTHACNQQREISLEKCAIAASQWHHGKKLGKPAWDDLDDHIKLMYIEQTKAVLDAAGVKYED